MNSKQDQKIIEMAENGSNIYRISKELGLNYKTVQRVLHINGVSLPDGRERKFTKSETKDIIERYAQGEALKSIASLYNTKSSRVRVILEGAGVQLRTLKEQAQFTKHEKRVYDKLDLGLAKKKYFDERLSLNEASKVVGCAPHTLKRFLQDNGCKVREGTEPECNAIDRDIFSNYPVDEVIDLYNRGYGAKEIARRRGMCTQAVYRLLRRENISIRSQEEWMETRMHWYKKYNLPSGKSIYVQGYEADFLDYVFQHELLQEPQIEFRRKCFFYEFEGKRKRYYPDFFIPHLNLVVEIKSKYIMDRWQGGEDVMELKANAVRDAGYRFIILYDKKHKQFTRLLKDLSRLDQATLLSPQEGWTP